MSNYKSVICDVSDLPDTLKEINKKGGEICGLTCALEQLVIVTKEKVLEPLKPISKMDEESEEDEEDGED